MADPSQALLGAMAGEPPLCHRVPQRCYHLPLLLPCCMSAFALDQALVIKMEISPQQRTPGRLSQPGLAPRGMHGSHHRASCGATGKGQARSGQVYYSAKIQDHESHKAAYAASEHRHLKSSYARIVT